jgi:hypothetical protein
MTVVDRSLVVPGPVPFDRAWLMRRLKLLERWSEGRSADRHRRPSATAAVAQAAKEQEVCDGDRWQRHHQDEGADCQGVCQECYASGRHDDHDNPPSARCVVHVSDATQFGVSGCLL